jgi:chitinase
MKYWIIASLVVILSCSEKSPIQETEQKSYHIIGYVAGWKPVKPKRIPAEKLTHINYAFANVENGVIAPIEGRSESDSLNFIVLNSLKTRNPDLKILVSIGGWTHSKGFSDAVLTEESRKKLTNSGIDFLLKYNLDGLDFDWEYPGYPGDNNPYRPEDKDNFVAMLKSFREAMDSIGNVNGRHYLSTIASGGFRGYLEANNMAEAQKYLDFINIMAYDYYTAGDTMTGHHANLYPNGEKGMSAQSSVEAHLEFGIPAEKLVLGVPFYGRVWKGVGAKENGLFQPGNYAMGLPFQQIYALSKNSAYSRFWDAKAGAPYLFSVQDSTWITYEDPESLSLKMNYVKEKGLAGAMFWEMAEDNSGILLQSITDELNPKTDSIQ